jgi:hypothetical protein
LRNINGYSNFINRRYSELLGRDRQAFAGFRGGHVNSSAIADLFAVKYMAMPLAGAGIPAVFSEPVFQRDDAVVLAKRDPIPRFHLACRARPAPDDMEGFLSLVDSGRIDFRREVLAPPGTKFANDWSRCRSDPRAFFELRETAPGLLQGRVSLSQPALLVLTQTYDPGWEAFIDGKAAPVQRANYAFQVVELPAGMGALELRFRPKHYTRGVWATGLAAAFLVVLWALPLLRKPWA